MALTVISASAAVADEEALFSGVTTIVAPYSPSPSVKVDGAILPGEYDTNVTFTTSDSGISISYVHDNDSLFVGIESQPWSWVAIGLSSDNATTMGFIIVTLDGSGFSVHERISNSVSEDMTLASPPTGTSVEAFSGQRVHDNASAEIQLSLDSSMWSLAPGVVYPTVVASNITASAGVPTHIAGSDVHFLGSYLLRADDSVHSINDLLNGSISPVPSAVALVIIAVGVAAIFTEFVIRRRAQ